MSGVILLIFHVLFTVFSFSLVSWRELEIKINSCKQFAGKIGYVSVHKLVGWHTNIRYIHTDTLASRSNSAPTHTIVSTIMCNATVVVVHLRSKKLCKRIQWYWWFYDLGQHRVRSTLFSKEIFFPLFLFRCHCNRVHRIVYVI